MSNGAGQASYRFGHCELQPGQQRLLVEGQAVAVGPRAFDLLVALVERAGELVSKDELLARVWPKLVVEENNLQVHVSALRKILGQDAIATVPGRGYRFALQLEGHASGTSTVPAAPKHNLPRPLTRFIGREDALAECAQILERVRLLTLTGIGGCGKTRLAIRLAELLLPSFDSDVCFVDLAPIAEPGRVALSVATAFDVREEPDKTIEETLLRHFADRRALLVLDNCEHLLDACVALAEPLLRAAPRLHILVTSREGLGIAGERMFAVQSLAMPAAGDESIEAVRDAESVQLFVERATDVVSQFRLDDANVGAVAEICRRLDGIPLALELAAAKLKILSIDQIRGRLADRFTLLAGRARAMSRHQTLLATLQWSYEHLTLDEQRWLQCLSVFAGGWTLEAAAAVVGERGDEGEALERLERLVDLSLVVVERSAPAELRYGMLETVRQYAQDRLVESGSTDAARSRHLAYFLAFSERARPNLYAREAKSWLARVDRELSNLLAAHAWCDHDPDGTDRGLQLAFNICMYWHNRGLFVLGRQVCTEALARPGADRSISKARALLSLGVVQRLSGRVPDAIEPLKEALTIAGEHDDEDLIALCLNHLAWARLYCGDLTDALEYAEKQLTVARRIGPAHLSIALQTKALICRMQCDFDAAAAYLDEALAGHDSDNRERSHVLLEQIVRVSIARGRLDRATQPLVESIRVSRELDSQFRAILSIDLAALLAAANSEWERAVRLQSVFDATLDRMGGLRNILIDDAVLEELRKKPRQMLGKDWYEAAYADGRNVTTEQAMSETIAWLARDGEV
jgi:non-specific serine/threonine protein kinase